MEKAKKYIRSCFGGMFCGNGCFVLPYKLSADSVECMLMKVLCFMAAIILIYAGCVIVLPEYHSKLDAEKFMFFALGMLFSVCIGK